MMESFDYRKARASQDGVPWVVETAFGWLGDGSTTRRQLVTGVNWSPGIVNPFRELGATARAWTRSLSSSAQGATSPSCSSSTWPARGSNTPTGASPPL